jgi:hypothetical protein
MKEMVMIKKFFLLIVSACITICTVSCIMCKHEKCSDKSVTAFEPDLYVIMSLQFISSQYGLPYRFSANCVITNRTMTVQVFDSAKDLIGKAVVGNRVSSREPEIRLVDCVKTENSVPPEIVSLALLRGYANYGYCLKNGFSVYVEKDSHGYFISVEDANLGAMNSYSMSIYGNSLVVGSGGR